MQNCLLIDFGSTYTKLTAVNLEKEVILGTAKAKTTIETSIMDGFYLAKKELLGIINQPALEFDHHFACSSAHGGFRMIAIGLSPTLTTEAAKRAALGAGTRILKVYSYGLKEKDLAEIESLMPDIILLCGGTDGGNKVGIIQDATMLTKITCPIPIVVAGNKEANTTIQTILSTHGITHYMTENVMPQINVLNPAPTRELLRTIFMENIVQAKGIDVAEKESGQILMPTPTAILNAADLLSKGTESERGLGNLLVIDIGGATTDIHSIGSGKPPTSDIRTEGLQEPFEKRTVEGDLGMRYSAMSLYEASYKEDFDYFGDKSKDDIKKECLKRMTHPDMLSLSKNDSQFDESMAKIAVKYAINRHAGTYRREPTPSRILLYQTGKDLSQFKVIIGTGGILVHSHNALAILEASLPDAEDAFLKPIDPLFYLDDSYILSAMGLLSDVYPDIALRIMKHYLRVLHD